MAIKSGLHNVHQIVISKESLFVGVQSFNVYPEVLVLGGAGFTSIMVRDLKVIDPQGLTSHGTQ